MDLFYMTKINRLIISDEWNKFGGGNAEFDGE